MFLLKSLNTSHSTKIIDYVTALISPCQFGFLQCRSTTQQLILLLNDIHNTVSTWHVMDIYDDFNDVRHFFATILHRYLDMYAPSHTVPIKHSHRPTPWTLSDLLNAIKHKLTAKRRAESTRLDADVLYYKQLKNKLKFLAHEAKISYLNQLLLKLKRHPRSSAELRMVGHK